MDIKYTARATSAGDARNGEVRSDDGIIDEKLAMPKEIGGPGGDATNPEQLFAAGYAACFHSAIKFVAARQKLDVTDSEVSATVFLGMVDTGFGLAVELDVHIPNLDADAAQALTEAAHEVCPYSNATRGNIEVKLTVV
jgi:lipoyl-dependent peroxiredoxin